ncbi:MAG: AcvB/VirJ family lysyl-phosphatidylglycerol hydrolase [Vicinamibacterales bacterium]
MRTRGRRLLRATMVMMAVACANRAWADEAARHQARDTVRVPGAGEVTIYRPDGPVREVVIFLSGDGGWNHGVVDMAQRLRAEGALVAGVDVRPLLKSMNAASPCAYPGGVLEEIARAVQQFAKVPAYHRPILAGYSSGATVVYAALAGAPAESFAGAISLGFCPDLALTGAPMCRMRGVAYTRRPKGTGIDLAPYPASTVPWMVLQGDQDQVCNPPATRTFVQQTGAARLFWLEKVGHGYGVPSRWMPQFVEAYRAVTTAHAASSAPASAIAAEVSDLGLEEVPATGGPSGDQMAVILTGDGGWAEIDKALAKGFASAGIPVVGWSSLSYYWTPRTPEAAAADLARVIDYYTRTWRKSRVLVVGYSFGADVASYLVNRLPAETRAHVARVALLGVSSSAAFEFHVADWLGGGSATSYPTLPEIRRLRAPVTCVYARDEADSICRQLPADVGLAVGEGHHFSGEYARIVQALVR